MNPNNVDWQPFLDALVQTVGGATLVFVIGFVFGLGFLYAMKVVKP